MTKKQKTKAIADTEVNQAIEIAAPEPQNVDLIREEPAVTQKNVTSDAKQSAVTREELSALMAEIQLLRAQLTPQKDEDEEEWVSDVLDSDKAREAILSFIRSADGYMAIGEYEGNAPYIELIKSVNLMVKRSKSLSVFQPHEPIAEETLAVYAVIGWNDYAEWDSSFVYRVKTLGARVITLRSLKDIPAVMNSIGE